MIKRELALILIVRSLAVLIDFLTYRGLVWSAAVSVDIANGSGFLIGTVLAYFAIRLWRFGHTQHEVGSPWRLGFFTS